MLILDQKYYKVHLILQNLNSYNSAFIYILQIL